MAEAPTFLEVYLYYKILCLESTKFEFSVIEARDEPTFAILKEVLAKKVNDVTKILRDIFSLHKKTILKQ